MIIKLNKKEGRIVMKSTGIIRRVDELGRVVIPKEIRETFNIKEKSQIEIYVDKGRIVLEKATITCQFCGSEENLKGFNGKAICTKCLKKLQENKVEKIEY